MWLVWRVAGYLYGGGVIVEKEKEVIIGILS